MYTFFTSISLYVNVIFGLKKYFEFNIIIKSLKFSSAGQELDITS